VDDILMICNEIASENSNLSCFYPGEEFVNDVNNFADITHPNGIGFERYAKLMLEMERNSK
jgi:hypothetical protein